MHFTHESAPERRDLLEQALPPDVPFEILGAAIPGDDDAILEQRLRQCGRLNWQAYLANYGDVAASGADPASHFLRHGMYEGRRLFSWHPFHEREQDPDAPEISVIVSNYNNEMFLGKCLDSLISQTFSNIEIIVADDGSSDASVEIARERGAMDSRIRALPLRDNQSLHMTRMRGVPAARGHYIMFVDSDDFYEPNACETALREIKKGWDIVAFNINFVNHSTLGASAIRKWEQDYNQLPAGCYHGEAVKSLPYMDGKLPCLIWSKIYEAQFLKKCYALMQEGYHNLYEDLYEFLVITDHARNLRKIDARLVNYSFGTGITTGGQAEAGVFDPKRHAAIYNLVEPYCHERNLPRHSVHIKNFLFRSTLRFVRDLNENNCAIFMNGLIEQYGVKYIAENLMREYFYHMNDLSQKLAYWKTDVQTGALTSIGLLIYDASFPAESDYWFEALGDKKGINVSIFSPYPPSGEKIFPNSKCFHVAGHGDDPAAAAKHLRTLYHAATRIRLDAMICMDASKPFLFWDSLLLRSLGVPVIGYYPASFTREIDSRMRVYKHYELLSSLRCLDKLLCRDADSELYFRCANVDAVSLDTSWQYLDEDHDDASFLDMLGTCLRQSPLRNNAVHKYRKILKDVIKRAYDV